VAELLLAPKVGAAASHAIHLKVAPERRGVTVEHVRVDARGPTRA
jgi:hypothetical protein